MTREEKQLLLIDLCARLPYGLLVKTPDHYSPQVVNSISDNLEVIVKKNLGYSLLYEAKPYLRPMSSMIEEERNEYLSIKMQETERVALAEIYRPEAISEIIDWLNAHHFDYRGLIEKGLALEASKGMYNIKTE